MYWEVAYAEKLLKRTFWIPKNEIFIFMTGGLIQKKQTIKVLNITQFNILSWYLKRKIFRKSLQNKT